ncbi:SDR family NAD(P)-dependent oxidoreductase [Streptomyces sp. NPDC000658]|uniref:SDR family NAD(P)-dependent oxidoreductase n=1 Tax=Streptomyces sp. NPDC000658 TaxID=3154266 RepID=UPI00332F9687
MRTRTGSATTPPAVGTDVSAHPTATTTTPANLRGQSTSFGVYAASKWAVEGLSEALAAEVAGQNIKVTLVEPGPYRSSHLACSITCRCGDRRAAGAG